MTASASPVPSGRTTRQAVLAALVVVLVHIVVVWGYPSIFWGDNGRWLYELDRVAHGAVFYRDVYWAFPPLAMWILGGLARATGSGLVQVWTMTATIACLIAVTYGTVVARLVDGRAAVLIAAVGMFLGAVYSQQLSAPLALGMYTPAVPVAALCLFVQTLLFLRDWERPTLTGAVAVGVVGALGFLAKHDVWLACVWFTFVAGVVTPLNESPTSGTKRVARLLAAGGGFLVVAAFGVLLLTAQHGPSALRQIFTGYGHVEEFAGVNLPDLSLLTVELATTSIAVALVALVGLVSGAWRGRMAVRSVVGGLLLALLTTALWLWKAEAIAHRMLVDGVPQLASPFERALLPLEPTTMARLRSAFAVLRLQLLRHLISLFVPVGLLVLASVRRRHTPDQRRWLLLIVLLAGCVALRARRMISYTEWSELMFELPVYVLALRTLWPTAEAVRERALQLTSVLLVAFALLMNWRVGNGFGSRRGVWPVVETARGRAHMPPGVARDYAYVRDIANSIDPSGTRPVFAFGYSSGLSYFTGRPSVGSMSQGFRLSLYPSPDSGYRVVEQAMPNVILADNPTYVDAIPSATFAPWRWMPEMRQNSYLRADRPLFDKLREGCTPVVLSGRTSRIFTVYDCRARPRGIR